MSKENQSQNEESKKWIYVYAWTGKEVETVKQPSLSGWYPVREVVNQKLLRIKIHSAYWNGSFWADNPESKRELEVFAFCPSYYGSANEALDHIKKYSTRLPNDD